MARVLYSTRQALSATLGSSLKLSCVTSARGRGRNHMPLFDFKCDTCLNKFEHLFLTSDILDVLECPNCQGLSRRQLAAPGYKFIKRGNLHDKQRVIETSYGRKDALHRKEPEYFGPTNPKYYNPDAYID